VGKIIVPKGKSKLVLTASKIAYSEVAEVKSIILEK
jgi:hypothetical protein